MQPDCGERLLEEGGGALPVRRGPKMHLHSSPEMRHQVGESLRQLLQVPDPL